MGFIDDQHALRQPPLPQRRMARRQHREQCLVDRADPDIGQKSAPAIRCHPRRTLRIRRLIRRIEADRAIVILGGQDGFLEFLIQLPPTMRQHERGCGTIGEQRTIGVAKAGIHGIGRSHGWQRDKHAMTLPREHQAVRQ